MGRPVTSGSSELHDEWRLRTTSLAWTFPADWEDPAVEALCEAIDEGGNIWPAAERLGRARAAAGVSLAEALADIDVLATITDPRYTESLRRAVSLGWADRVTAPPAAVSDPLTGLVTPEYLKVRLAEIYRAAEVEGGAVPDSSALVVVRLDLTDRTGWQRVLPMILSADVMRSVFDGGRTLAQLGPSVAVVLTDRDAVLARRARLLATMIGSQLAVDPAASIPDPQVWIENLPPTYNSALDLLGELGR
ncbi:GGDEF domain-containing protein [Nakamurella sp. YIM 132087]|uniref:GGDEF domain-containing protein n=1 Tax=Nakamurella alba TaxID=2665158 RepID=A0A7K1FJ93_9ACTN|nr:GGDEF domain-containing protein [Nakamurella alba]MTD14140.1 GGDEF domain-containing protein [Nakamurella alba]